MTGPGFARWRKRMDFSKPAAARALGVSRNMPRRYETGEADVPLYIALACTAVTLGLRPYADDPTEEQDEDLVPYSVGPAGDPGPAVPRDSGYLGQPDVFGHFEEPNPFGPTDSDYNSF